MREYHVSRKRFLDAYSELFIQVKSHTASYVESRSLEDLRRTRASIRRLDAMFSLLPKSLTKDLRIAAFRRTVDRFYKTSTKLVDYEAAMVELVLPSSSGDSTHISASALGVRTRAAAAARRLAVSLGRMSLPILERQDLSNKRLSRRLTKKAGSIARRMDEDWASVLADSRNVHELHRLRGESRKLRYLLALAEGPKRISRVSQVLVDVQDSLGEIRNCDVAMALLEGADSTNRSRHLRTKVSRRRNALFHAFVKKYAKLISSRQAFTRLL